MTLFKMTNPVQNYDWGSKTDITQLFDIENPDQKPMAEIWMGAHPKAPSGILVNTESVTLSDFLKQHPEHLGQTSLAQFGTTLPFLFKVLSADSPLSIQVHPNKQQAEAGFDKEQQEGISLDAFDRNYRDSNHKPELVYALTPFKAMNGFREVSEIVSLFSMMHLPVLEAPLITLKQAGDRGLKSFYEGLMTLTVQQTQSLLDHCIRFADTSDNSVWQEVKALNGFYPGDIGVLSPLLLNVIDLQPGQAMFLKAGTLHAYMKGTALEIMACSDNVLRGGLTSKHVDIDELLNTLVFSSIPASALLQEPEALPDGSVAFHVPVQDFLLSIASVHQPVLYSNIQSAEIVFCIEGELSFLNGENNSISLKSGVSCFVSALTDVYQVTGKGKMAKATIGL